MMVSANSEIKDVLKGLEHGANDYIRKPFQREDLHMRVQVCTANVRSCVQCNGSRCMNAMTHTLNDFVRAGPYTHNAVV